MAKSDFVSSTTEPPSSTTLAKVVELGGTILEDTRSDFALMIRDPDGQLIEILPMEYRRRMAEQGF